VYEINMYFGQGVLMPAIVFDLSKYYGRRILNDIALFGISNQTHAW